MKVLKFIKPLSLALLFLGLTSSSVLAQSDDGKQAYQDSYKAVQAKKLGEAKTLIATAVRLEPKNADYTYLQAYILYANDDLLGAIEAYDRTVELATASGDNAMVAKAQDKLDKAYVKLVNSGQAATALAKINEALAGTPNEPKLLFSKAFLTRKNGDLEGSNDIYKQAVEAAEAAGDTDLAERAQKNLAQGYVTIAAQYLNERRGRQALELLTSASEMSEPTADLHYYFAKAYNETGNHTSAAEHATAAIELEKGSRTQKAKIFFELGVAYKQMGNIAEARAAFEQAAIGSFKDAAEYELKFIGEGR